jgi:hypothetical protein
MKAWMRKFPYNKNKKLWNKKDLSLTPIVQNQRKPQIKDLRSKCNHLIWNSRNMGQKLSATIIKPFHT